MAGYIGALALAHIGNWEICKRERLWGVPAASSNARKAALMVEEGEPLFLWRSGGPGRSGGLFARAEATSRAIPAVNVPWPDSDRYSHVFSIRVTDELPAAVADAFPGNRTSVRFGLQNIWINWGFWHLPSDVVVRMNAAFHQR